jgi:hypothetical protein
MPYNVHFTPLSGIDAGQPRILVEKYLRKNNIRTERSMVDLDIARSTIKHYRPVNFEDEVTAKIGAEEFLAKLRNKKPNIRNFRIEYISV